jgi:hypothetical protein
MDTQKLHAMLGGLSGHLAAETPEQEREVGRLQQLLSRSLLSEDAGGLRARALSHEGADLFDAARIPAARAASIRAVAEARAASAEEPEFRVFVREVPVRSTQLHGSTPLWAGGAAVERTLGPFRHDDGRVVWFDFIRIEKLIALYVQGQAEPALLFKVAGSRLVAGVLRPEIELNSYSLSAGSIWINSRLLAPDAPAGYFTGLAISGGTVALSEPPQTIGDKLTIGAATRVRVTLQPRQPDAPDAADGAIYGADARAAVLRLPARFALRFTGAAGKIEAVGGAGWNVYGHEAAFEWNPQGAPRYDAGAHRVLVPLNSSTPRFEVSSSRSPFHTLKGAADIKAAAWALPAAPIDVANPTPAAGAGGLLVECDRGLSAAWQNLAGGEVRLNNPRVLAEPGRVSVTDLKAAGGLAQQELKLWTDEQNPHGTSVRLLFPKEMVFSFFTHSEGGELLAALCHADFRVDRPVTVKGEPPAVRSKNSLLLLWLDQTQRVVYLFDDNMLLDNLDPQKPALPEPLAFALNNALFKVTPPNGCILFGRLDEELSKVVRGWLYLTFAMYAYLPTLPDPYAANIGFLRFQFRGLREGRAGGAGFPWLWLVCRVKWAASAQPGVDSVEVSFHFAPLENQFQALRASDFTSAGLEFAAAPRAEAERAEGARAEGPRLGVNVLEAASVRQAATVRTAAARVETPEGGAAGELRILKSPLVFGPPPPLPDYGVLWDERTRLLGQDFFALLDVSTNADLFGISFGANLFGDRRFAMVRTHEAAGGPEGQQAEEVPGLPIQVEGLDVVSRGAHVRAFTVPQISWEPVYNLTPPGPPPEDPPLDPPPPPTPGDPALGFNYYPDDGGPARILNNGDARVALAPIPVTEYLVNSFADEKFLALAAFGLPFGMKALALLRKKYTGREGTRVSFDTRHFTETMRTGRRLKVLAGEPEIEGQGDMFMGSAVQLNNVLDFGGAPTGNSTLGRAVTKIFNQEFFDGGLVQERGVPLSRVDLSGYGASIFSNWVNPKAPIASTSQARFDVFVGRCAHEVIQVVSILYPWGAVLVRTITLFRASTNYVFRHDSGWVAVTDGLFDFSHFAYDPTDPPPRATITRPSPYEIHRGVVGGVFNIRNIKETASVKPFTGTMTIPPNTQYVDGEGFQQQTGPAETITLEYDLQPVFFDADVEIENPLSGFAEVEIKVAKKQEVAPFKVVIVGEKKKVVASKRVLGFVQISPLGQPLTPAALAELVARQGSIGGPLDCVVNVAGSSQEMRLNRFDVSNSVGADGFSPAFAATARGNVALPKDGAWSMVRHDHASGSVSPLAPDLSVPLVRRGRVVRENDVVKVDPAPAGELVRVAEPMELLRQPTNGTVNYGFLHTSDTQKALFLNPSFKPGVPELLSKTRPLFADAFRIASSKAVFPNAGDAVASFGDAISLVRTGGEFNTETVNGQQVFKLMEIGKVAEGQGYRLLKKVPAEPFRLPDRWNLIEVGTFRIYIEYKAEKVKRGGGVDALLAGGLDFNVDSFTNNVAERWKSHMSNVSIVVDLGPIPRLMTIKGNWDAKKGAEAAYAGSGSAAQVPSPQVEFAGVLDPAMKILEILEALQTGDYAGAFGSGVRLAMSNKAGTWEYKFEATKEIPVLRFPPGLLYNDPNAPLKLEAGLRLGAYFNAALKVPSSPDPSQLLPSAGALFGFYGRLSVMCVSLSVATIYAVGQVNLDIAADTKARPSLRMKFGFGAQIVVGLPVVGNVGVLYMVGVEIFLGATTVEVSAFLLFQGHAELLGGLIGVTITIEAKGTVTRDEAADRTDLAAQVTFGLEISLFLIIDISFSTSWGESRQIA